jgi:hypothetical protein
MVESDHQTTDRPPKQLLRSDFHVQKAYITDGRFEVGRVFVGVAVPNTRSEYARQVYAPFWAGNLWDWKRNGVAAQLPHFF